MISQNTMIGLLAIGGGGYYLLSQKTATAPIAGAPKAPAAPAAAVRAPRVKSARQAASPERHWDARLGKFVLGSLHAGAGKLQSSSGYPKEVEDEIKNKLKKSWEAADAAAKIAICERLKSQFPADSTIQAMQCSNAPNMAFQAVLAAAAAAAGGALCGPPCSIVGMLVVAWAGPKLEEWANDVWDGVSGAAEDVWDAAGDTASDVWNWF